MVCKCDHGRHIRARDNGVGAESVASAVTDEEERLCAVLFGPEVAYVPAYGEPVEPKGIAIMRDTWT
jgi:hypothetical protein